jgi:hypothetical protein
MVSAGERWLEFVYRTYDPDEVGRWVRSLEFFRFVRRSAGPVFDVDRLVVRLELDDDARRIGARVESIEGRATFASEGPPGQLVIGIYGERDDPHLRVTESTVELARGIEAELRPLRARIVDPPHDSEYCICPKYYPEIWTARTS